MTGKLKAVMQLNFHENHFAQEDFAKWISRNLHFVRFHFEISNEGATKEQRRSNEGATKEQRRSNEGATKELNAYAFDSL